MAELVDAVDSKSTVRKDLGVRVPLPVPTTISLYMLPTMKYCSRCGAEGRDPPGPNPTTASAGSVTSCNTIHYQNPLDRRRLRRRDRTARSCCASARSNRATVIGPCRPVSWNSANRLPRARPERDARGGPCAEVEIGHLFASIDVVDAGQVHTCSSPANVKGGYGVGEESLDTRLFAEDEIPWDETRFSGAAATRWRLTSRIAAPAKKLHIHELRRAKLAAS